MRKTNIHERGFLILESLIAVVLLSMIVISIFPTINFLLLRTRRAAFDVEASLLLQEGLEATYNIFSTDWTAYPNGSYKLAVAIPPGFPQEKRWALISAPQEIIEARYTRIIEISQVRRDPTTGVRSDTGNPDPNSRLVSTKIFWKEGEVDQEIEAELLLTNVLTQ